MTLPPDLERRVLALHCPREGEARSPAPLVAGGEADPSPPLKGGGKPPLVAASFAPPATWVIPLVLPSLANERQWQARNRAAKAHRTAVCHALARHLGALVPLAFAAHHGGRSIRCRLTRLGGRALDRTANLPAALKYVEDAVCLMLGLDDADPRWVCEVAQEPGGACGVRVGLGVDG